MPRVVQSAKDAGAEQWHPVLAEERMPLSSLGARRAQGRKQYQFQEEKPKEKTHLYSLSSPAGK